MPIFAPGFGWLFGDAEDVGAPAHLDPYIRRIDASAMPQRNQVVEQISALANDASGAMLDRLERYFAGFLEETLGILSTYNAQLGCMLETGKGVDRVSIMMRHPEILTTVSQHGRPDNGSDASPFSNVEIFAPLKPFDEWRANYTKEKLIRQQSHVLCKRQRHCRSQPPSHSR